MRRKPEFPKRPQIKRVALVLQGGGALGAYQVGVYQALQEHGFSPDWVAGTSIGAINAAIIAGNPAGSRFTRLQEFWRSMSRPGFWDITAPLGAARQFTSLSSALEAVLLGQKGFFTPRLLDPLAACTVGSAEAASFYDTSELRGTLLRLADFELINRRAMRLSLGAVHVRTGRLRYFDNEFERLGPEHVMASGALPPGFPAVRVDGELYWDGGVYSNTPLEIVLDDMPRVNTLCFMVDLFNPAGPEPRSIAEVLVRHKDIMYATRSRQHIEAYCKTHNLRRAVDAIYQRLPREQRADPEMKALAELGCHTTMEIVHFGYPGRDWELVSKDIDFSSAAIEERWRQGYRDALRAVERAAWLDPVPPHTGVVVHELPPETA
jgi:NTE family protein